MAYEFEKEIIIPILDIIKNEQDYLCKKENLPQLAKLGFMFNTLFYGGRVAYGYNGIIEKGDSCEDNPKYMIEDFGNTDEQEDYIYDAWGMHVSYRSTPINFDEFKYLILNGKALSEYEKKSNKPDKTFDEWVDLLMDNEYQYTYDSRRGVADQLLCTNGNGYDLSDRGFIIESSSGSNIDDFGDWKNAKLRDDILEEITTLLNIPEMKLAIDADYKQLIEYNEKEEKRRAKYENYEISDDTINSLLKKLNKNKDTKEIKKPKFKEHPYYPLCQYALLCNFDEKTHISYIKEGMKVCQEIVADEEHYKDDRNDKESVRRAKTYIKKWKHILN